MNGARGLHCQCLEQFLVLGGERVQAIRIHVQHPAHLAIDLEWYRQLGAHLRPQSNITRIFGDVADAGRVAGSGYPPGNAFPHPELQLGCSRRQAPGGMNFKQAGRGIDEHG